mmetsp:Transcript_7514/g.16575  ORF Transcript_7514/g.16575 Transcript_7514/m.16575 type:complete len:485 (-) Transcript_7514:3226-4680(-)
MPSYRNRSRSRSPPKRCAQTCARARAAASGGAARGKPPPPDRIPCGPSRRPTCEHARMRRASPANLRDEQPRKAVVLDSLVERVGEEGAVLRVLHELGGGEGEGEADEESPSEVVVGLAREHHESADDLGQLLDGAAGEGHSNERGEEVAGGDGVVERVEEREARERGRHAHQEQRDDQRRDGAQRHGAVAQSAWEHHHECRDGEQDGEQKAKVGQLLQEADLQFFLGECREHADEGERVAHSRQQDEELLGPRARLQVAVLLEPPALPRRERRRVLALHPPPPRMHVLRHLLLVERERVEPKGREEPRGHHRPDGPGGAPIARDAVLPLAERVEHDQAPQQLEAVVQVRGRVEAEELSKLFVPHHETAASRTVLCAAVLERGVEVVCLGAHVEHEEKERAREVDLHHLLERRVEAVLDRHEAEDGHGEQQTELQRPLRVEQVGDGQVRVELQDVHKERHVEEEEHREHRRGVVEVEARARVVE